MEKNLVLAEFYGMSILVGLFNVKINLFLVSSDYFYLIIIKTDQIIIIIIIINQRRRKERQVLGPNLRTKKGHNDNNCNWFDCNRPQRLEKRAGKVGNRRISWNHPSYSIGEIGQNIEKSPGDLRRLDVSQTLVNDQQLMPVWKTRKEFNNKNNNNNIKTGK